MSGELDSVENERSYVARELHDGVAQTTQQIILQAGLCRKLLERRRLETLAEELATLEARAKHAAKARARSVGILQASGSARD